MAPRVSQSCYCERFLKLPPNVELISGERKRHGTQALVLYIHNTAQVAPSAHGFRFGPEPFRALASMSSSHALAPISSLWSSTWRTRAPAPAAVSPLAKTGRPSAPANSSACHLCAGRIRWERDRARASGVGEVRGTW
eukprot:6198226-Pleurochrysis_carterae.AAC.1